MAKALVTGANGFIGSHLVRELLNRGYEVNCLVRHTSDLVALAGLPVTLFIGDVREPETLIAPMEQVELVFHLAAELMVTSRQAFDETNTQGTQHMLDAAERHAAGPLRRFLFVSSQAASGPGEDPTPYDETRAPQPVSWYGTSKMRAEELVQVYADRLPVTIVRPPAVYGERERDISQTFGTIAHRLQPVLGLSKKYTVMVYVRDLVRGMVDAAESDATLNQVYLLNHPEVLTTSTVVRTMAEGMGKPQGIRFPVPILVMRCAAPLAELIHHFTRNRPALTRDKVRELSQRYWVSDPSKAKRDFGWEAEYDLLGGMRLTTRHFFDQEQKLREMPLETATTLWLKYVAVGIVLGSMVEITSALGRFYQFTPWWLVFLVAIGAFGVTLGTVAMWLRKTDTVVQFLVGTVLAFGGEAFNVLQVLPSVGWEFAPGWPFGITNDWARSVVLGFAGGVFIVVLNAIMRSLYKRRLRLG